jgi:hypothetical protein
MRVLFDPTDKSWRKNQPSYCVFHKKVVQSILQGEGQVALKPEAYLPDISVESL